MILVEHSVDVDVLIGAVGNVSAGYELDWPLSEDSPSSLLLLVSSQLTSLQVYQVSGGGILALLHHGGQVV